MTGKATARLVKTVFYFRLRVKTYFVRKLLPCVLHCHFMATYWCALSDLFLYWVQKCLISALLLC
jgi:hypothetical protein